MQYDIISFFVKRLSGFFILKFDFLWSTALIFSNKDHSLQKKTIEKNRFLSMYYEKIIELCVAHTMTSHAVWVDKIMGVMISINKIVKNILKK